VHRHFFRFFGDRLKLHFFLAAKNVAGLEAQKSVDFVFDLVWSGDASLGVTLLQFPVFRVSAREVFKRLCCRMLLTRYRLGGDVHLL
jgi:hypothetical protein